MGDLETINHIETNMPCAQILIVEDEGLVAEDIKAHLEANNWQVAAIVPSGEAALQILQGTHIDLIMMDIVLKGAMDGIQTAEIIRKKYQKPVIYLTAYTDTDKIQRASKTNPYGYLVKPFDERELKTTVSMGLSKAAHDRAIKEDKRWAQSVLHSIEDGVITTNINGHIRDINPKACEILQVEEGSSYNRAITEIFRFANPATQQHLKNTLQSITQSRHHIEYRFDGKLQTKAEPIIDAKLSNVIYDDGSTDGMVITFHDVTLEHKARESLSKHNYELERRVEERTEEIRRALDKAQTAVIAKDRFLGNISHELRTPLNPISTLSQILMLQNMSAEQQKEIAGKIYQSSLELLDMIDDLILLRDLDDKKFNFDNAPFNPTSLILDCVNRYRAIAEDKNIGIHTELPEDKLEPLLGDYTQLKIIIEHLADNAIKFTEQGNITLGLTLLDDTADTSTLRFSVKDNGPGISEDIADELFQRFIQGDDSNTKSKKGMGIGLNLSKLLVEHMDGRIQARNKDNGAEFWFDLCFKKAGNNNT